MSLSTNSTVPKTWNQKFREINIICMFFSFFVFFLYGGFVMHDDIYNRCGLKYQLVSFTIYGVIGMGISLLGLLADVHKKPYLQSLYLLMLLVVIFVMIITAIFAFVVTAKGAGKGYKLGDYSPYIRKRISNWNNVKNECLLSDGFCSYDDSPDFEVTQVTYHFCIEMYMCLPPFNCFINFRIVLEFYMVVNLTHSFLYKSSPHTPLHCGQSSIIVN